MAGSYPDVPGYRFAYDLDGTLVVAHPKAAGTAVAVPSATLTTLNNDAINNTYAPGNSYFAFLFPEPRDITGIFFSKGVSLLVNNLSISRDTTNGLDGTWETVVPVPPAHVPTNQPSPRIGIQPLNLTNITSLQFDTQPTGGDQLFRAIHLYGNISPENSFERLRIVDMSQTSTTSDNATSTGEDISAQFDFGDIRQQASSVKQFRVVNNSSTQSAENITVSLQAPVNATPSLVGQFQISTDGIAYANAVNVGTLNPGESSAAMYLKINVAANMQLSTWSARIIAHAVSWS